MRYAYLAMCILKRSIKLLIDRIACVFCVCLLSRLGELHLMSLDFGATVPCIKVVRIYKTSQ